MEVLNLLTALIALCVAIFNLGYIAANQKPKQEHKTISEEEKRRIEKDRREMMNFYTYNGDSQSH